MTGTTLWTLTNNGHSATARTGAVRGVGLELRFEWNGELRQSRVYHDHDELASDADIKRRALQDQGWVDAPPHWQSGSVS